MYIEKSDSSNKKYDLYPSLNQTYSRYNKIKISWQCKDNSDRGYFELLSNNEIFEKQEEFFELAKNFKDDDSIDDIDTIVEDIINWLPVFRFPNGDMFCIDKRNDKVVFFDHEVRI